MPLALKKCHAWSIEPGSRNVMIGALRPNPRYYMAPCWKQHAVFEGLGTWEAKPFSRE
jgi:hypothetical protein